MLNPLKAIKEQLLIAFVTMVLFTAAVIGGNSIYSSLESEQRQVTDWLEASVVLKETQISQWQNSLENELSLLVNRQDIAPRLRTILQSKTYPETTRLRLHQDFQQVIDLTQHFKQIALLNLEGTVMASSDVTQEGNNYEQHAYFRQALISSFFQPPRYFPSFDETLVVVARPVLHPNGHILGILVGFADLQHLNEVMLERTGFGETGETYLVNLKHQLLTESRFPDYPRKTTLIQTEGATFALRDRINGAGFYNNYQDIPVVGVYHWLPNLHVALLAEQSQAEAFQPLYNTTLSNVGIVIATVVIAVLLALLVTRSITTPLIKLSQTATEIAAGNLNLTAHVERQDEIGTLANAFNSMTAQLHELINRLEDRVEERTRAIETSADISRRITSMLDIDILLQYVVNCIQEEFNFYHVHIYLVEEGTNDLLMMQGSGEVGAKLKARKHRLKAGRGIVGKVAATNEYLLSNNVFDVPNFVRNALLPDTKSELAVPLRKGDTTLGVLDIQSTQLDEFTLDDVAVIQLIGDQTAVAIDNARLLTKITEHLTKLQEVDRLKSEFLTTMSHELRTPLNSILGFTELLLEGISGELPDMARNDILTIHKSGQHLLAILNDLLDISKIEAGLMEIVPEPLEVLPLMSDVLATAELLIQNKSLELVTHFAPNLPLIQADKTRLKQVLLNLLDNAIKFTDEGQVIIKINVDDHKKDTLKFSIKDTGIGIPADKLALIFEVFHQVDMSKTRVYGGTGIGLAICKRLIEMHGGDINVASQEGVGSEFSFTIPLATPKKG